MNRWEKYLQTTYFIRGKYPTYIKNSYNSIAESPTNNPNEQET